MSPFIECNSATFRKDMFTINDGEFTLFSITPPRHKCTQSSPCVTTLHCLVFVQSNSNLITFSTYAGLILAPSPKCSTQAGAKVTGFGQTRGGDRTKKRLYKEISTKNTFI